MKLGRFINDIQREPACVFMKDLPFSVKKGLLIRTHVFFKVDETDRLVNDIQKEPACVSKKALVFVRNFQRHENLGAIFNTFSHILNQLTHILTHLFTHIYQKQSNNII